MTKAKTKRTVVRVLAIVLAVLMPVLTSVVAFAEPETGTGTVLIGQKKYESPDINALTGHGEEPEELSVSAGAEYLEKAWYEYVTYSEHAVASFRYSDTARLLFYDPYTYTNSMIMDVNYDAQSANFDTMSSYTVSHTISKSISTCESSTESYSTATQSSGRDITHTNVTNSGYTKTIYNHDTVTNTSGKIKDHTDNSYFANCDVTGYIKANVGITNAFVEDSIGYNEHLYIDCSDKTTTYENYKTTTDYNGYDKVENHTSSETEGWTELSDRVTKTLGASYSTSKTWSETEGTTVTKTYAATHFATDGVTPLPWAIVHYSVKMPVKCCLQLLVGGEWITTTTCYCLLTTVEGTCRAWKQNGQLYYEDWGGGNPVVATNFWSQYMSTNDLIRAYNDSVYPAGGVE